MDPNYDEWADFHGVDQSLEQRVLHYLFSEWMVDALQYPQEIRDRVFRTIQELGPTSSVPHIAGKIAMEVLPI